MTLPLIVLVAPADLDADGAAEDEVVGDGRGRTHGDPAQRGAADDVAADDRAAHTRVDVDVVVVLRARRQRRHPCSRCDR